VLLIRKKERAIPFQTEKRGVGAYAMADKASASFRQKNRSTAYDNASVSIGNTQTCEFRDPVIASPVSDVEIFLKKV
jgi:hypothetical protein